MTSFKLSDWPIRVTARRVIMEHKHNTNDWYGKIWPMYSNWCNQTYGSGNLEYYYGQFLFKEEEHATLFTLRWLT